MEIKDGDFVAMSTALPLILGFMIAGTVHEPLHRPFALLIPGLRRWQIKCALTSVLVASIGVTLVTLWAYPTASPWALIGITLGLLSIPCLARYQHFPFAEAWLAFLTWLLATRLIGERLNEIMNTYPVLVLVCGVSVCIFSVFRGLSQETCRIRAHTPFLSITTQLFILPFRRNVAARWRTEFNHYNVQRKQKKTVLGRDWTVSQVGPQPLDWIRVLWHANTGLRKQGSFPRLQIRIAVGVVSGITAFILVQAIFSPAKPWPSEMFQAAFPIAQPMFAMIYSLMVMTPQLAYPISRSRLAKVVFWQASIQWLIALIVPVIAFGSGLIIVQSGFGISTPGMSLRSLLGTAMILAPLLPLLTVAGTFKRPVWRICQAVTVILSILILSFAASFWLSYVISVPGVVICLMATGVSQWFLWRRLHQNYANSDLLYQSGSSLDFGMSAFARPTTKL
jgi:hypothetical protein